MENLWAFTGRGKDFRREGAHSRLCRNKRVNLGQMCGVRLAAQRADEESTSSLLNKDLKSISSYFFFML